MSAYAETLTAFDAAQAQLTATSTADLLRSAYALTHRLHGLRTALDSGVPSSAERATMRAIQRDLRHQRDMIDAEILRRTDR